ncbi:MAG: hypothetical protein U0746_21995 [Gemmataceae bacterium]
MNDPNGFVGHARREPGNERTAAPVASPADRVAAARRMLLTLGLDGADPRWSSDVLDRLLTDVVGAPGGSIGDLFTALFGVLGEYSTELTQPVAALLKDLVVGCFTRHRGSYDAADWKGMADRLGTDATPAQLYLALHALPPQVVSSRLADAIAKGLEPTPYHAEAVSDLAV